jgi:hypothetical protein
VREARGYYRILVRHFDFEEGALQEGVARRGCVSYGQWRRFSLVGWRTDEAQLYAEVVAYDASWRRLPGMPISALYVRLNKPPTPELFDGAARTPQPVLTMSPCDVDEAYEWHLAAALDGKLQADADGVAPTYFELTPRLRSAELGSYAALDLQTDGKEVQVVAPRAANGSGYVCCGVFNLWIVRNLPSDWELVVRMTLTAGRARALYVKRASCPRYPEDIDPVTYGCAGRCDLASFVRYDTHTGGATYYFSGSAASGFRSDGFLEPAADWYLGVQALPAEDAEFELVVSSRPRPEVVVQRTCNRNDAFCPQDQKTIEGVTLNKPLVVITASAAPPRAALHAAAPLAALLLHAAARMWRRAR